MANKHQHYRQVARLHMEGIRRGFLSTLGEKFLALLYDCIDDAPETVLLTEMENDRVLNIMMFDFDLDVADLFYYDKYEQRKEGESEDEATRRISFEQTKAAGIDALCPGALFDPRAFEPCGYSMNAILYKSYYTMHITPEEGSSYASFETNQKLPSYTSLINNVVRTFRPRRFVITLMADEGGLSEIKGNPLVDTKEFSRINVPPKSKADTKLAYRRTNIASIKVEDDCCCMMGNWVIDNRVQENNNETRYRGMSFAQIAAIE